MNERATASNGTLLDVDDVFKHFGGIQAVNGASFEVPASSITALIGPNGAGKTTLFNVVTGFYKGDRGSVTFDGDDVFRHAPYEIAQRGMVRTFQITKALAAMPVIDNMMLAAPDQPGERFLNLIIRPGAVRAREKEVHEAGDGAARRLQPDQARRRTTRARSRAASASCWSWRGR